ncbi:MAG: sulfatase-like hydrolase/transferase [Verrucomicrobiota bacterium]
MKSLSQSTISSLTILLCVYASLREPSTAAEKPNIVFLLADDMGWGDLACYGHPVIKSPHLDQLAAEGVKLTDCYSASPNCSPSRTAILTGRSPYRVGMYDFARFPPMHIPTSELTIAEVLRDAGYQTMFGGKWHCSGDFENQPNPGDHGYDHWFAHPKNFGENPSGFFRNGEPLPKQKGWMSEIVIDEAIEFISKRDKTKPFHTMLWFSEPHTPVVAAEEFIEPYRNEQTRKAAQSIQYGGPQVKRKPDEKHRATYYGIVTMLDHHIGRLLTYLKDNGLEENTLVIFTSDNGPEHRPSTSFGTPGALRGAKGHMHEGGYRVPGIVKWPGKILASSVCAEPVNGTDFLPTLATVVGAKPDYPFKIDGANIMPALINEDPIERKTPMLWWLYHARGGKEVSMRDGDYKMLANMLPQGEITINDASPPKGVSIMNFIKNSDLGNFTLYNLARDRAEASELSTSEPEKFKQMRDKMIQLHAEIRAEGPVYDLGGKKKKR